MNNIKHNTIKRCVSFCLILCFALSILCACTSPAQGAKRELRILTEQTTWDRMNGQLSVLEKAYESEHPKTDVKVDYIPSEEQERDVYLQQLRTEILQGGGPDCYLLPTDTMLTLDEPEQYTYISAKPLFSDVEIAMRNGLFYDMTELYDTDSALDKENLNGKIMDAGVLDGVRYILPLRYDIPVIYAQNSALINAGLDPSILNQDIISIMEAVYSTKDPLLAGGILYSDFGAFTGFIDYQSYSTTLSEATLSNYMTCYRKLKALLGSKYLDNSRVDRKLDVESLAEKDTVLLENLDIRRFIYCEYGYPEKDPLNFIPPPDHVSEYYPLWIGSMQNVFDYMPLSVYEESDITITPLRTADGSDIIATVTYYAAIGSGCKDPELAYDFLRQFLLEESQWEQNRPKRNHTRPIKGSTPNPSNDLQYPNLIEEGWPVRDKNSLQTLWTIRRKQLYISDTNRLTDMQTRRMRKIGLTGELDAERIPLFDIDFAHVRFNTAISDELSSALDSLNDPQNGNAPTDVNIEELAEQLIQNMRWHVSE